MTLVIQKTESQLTKLSHHKLNLTAALEFLITSKVQSKILNETGDEIVFLAVVSKLNKKTHNSSLICCGI